MTPTSIKLDDKVKEILRVKAKKQNRTLHNYIVFHLTALSKKKGK